MLEYYYILVEEFSGYDCDGHWMPKIVAASSPEQAIELLGLSEYDRHSEPVKFELPPLAGKRKPHILKLK